VDQTTVRGPIRAGQTTVPGPIPVDVTTVPGPVPVDVTGAGTQAPSVPAGSGGGGTGGGGSGSGAQFPAPVGTFTYDVSQAGSAQHTSIVDTWAHSGDVVTLKENDGTSSSSEILDLTASGFLLQSQSRVQRGQTTTCDYTAPLPVEYPLPLAQGTSWSLDRGCTESSGARYEETGSADVASAASDGVGNSLIATWVVNIQRTIRETSATGVVTTITDTASEHLRQTDLLLVTEQATEQTAAGQLQTFRSVESV
jgi:hypothetical protein